MWPVSRTIDRYDTTFDHDGLISNAGLIVTATLMVRLGLEDLAGRWVRTGAEGCHLTPQPTRTRGEQRASTAVGRRAPVAANVMWQSPLTGSCGKMAETWRLEPCPPSRKNLLA